MVKCYIGWFIYRIVVSAKYKILLKTVRTNTLIEQWYNHWNADISRKCTWQKQTIVIMKKASMVSLMMVIEVQWLKIGMERTT